MNIKRFLRKCFNRIVKRDGFEIVRSDLLYPWQRMIFDGNSYNQQGRLPDDAKPYLQISNPRFVELQARYDAFDTTVTTPLIWRNEHVRPEDMLYFRGDNAYVWQLQGQNMNIMAYALTCYYIRSLDTLGLMDQLSEDDFFGNYTFCLGNKVISRDLLDSISEIHFLEKHLAISKMVKLNILDIGAGYGRLAYRMTKALDNLGQYLCTDAVATSTFICEYYTRFRNINDKAKVIPLDEIENTLRNTKVDIALNIHSFSECRVSAIQWWLELLARSRVKHLMIVPSAVDIGGPIMQNGENIDFEPIIKSAGYRLIAKEQKYSDPVVQQYAINPTYYYLFELC